jgi:hypothetical protein
LFNSLGLGYGFIIACRRLSREAVFLSLLLPLFAFRCAARSEAAHCRCEPPEEPDPRVIAHLLTFSNDFHIESNFCGP